MKHLGITLVLVLLEGVWAQVLPNVIRPACNSSEAEAAALVAQDYLNSQHTHGYKYALNRIEDIKIISMPGGEDTYILEVELLETNCHVLDPTPLANCTVRPKVLTAVEGDCDIILKKIGGVLRVTAFKCKTEESTEDICLGCPTLLPLNDTMALDFVYASMATFNNLTTNNALFSLMEVGRMTLQPVSGGAMYAAEYVVVEANCTGDLCEPQTNSMAQRGFCQAKGVKSAHSVNCNMFVSVTPNIDTNTTVVPVVPPSAHVHSRNLITKPGLRYHALTPLHDPQLSGLLSESDESAEVVPVANAAPRDPAVMPDAPAVADAAEVSVKTEAPGADPDASIKLASIALTSLCPGKVKYY